MAFTRRCSQVRGRADAARAGGSTRAVSAPRHVYYARGLEPRPPALAAQPGFDPLAVTIARAHDAGLQVHAWVNVNLVAGAGELPAAAITSSTAIRNG